MLSQHAIFKTPKQEISYKLRDKNKSYSCFFSTENNECLNKSIRQKKYSLKSEKSLFQIVMIDLSLYSSTFYLFSVFSKAPSLLTTIILHKHIITKVKEFSTCRTIFTVLDCFKLVFCYKQEKLTFSHFHVSVFLYNNIISKQFQMFCSDLYFIKEN